MPTIKDVAQLAQVSTSTVSRVLGGKVFVDEETRRRVQAAMDELHYRPNPLARALREKRTNTFALLVPGIENQIWPLVARGVENIARKNDYSVILCNTDNDVKVEKQYLARLQRRWVDGVIIAPAQDDEPHLHQLAESGFPIVQVIRGLESGMDSVLIDNFRIAYDAVEYLHKTGHRHIAIASGRQELNLYRRRLEGYRQAVKDLRLDNDERLVIQEIKELGNLYRLTRQRLEEGVPIDAVVATSDPKAIIVMRAIRDAGKRIPEDISVIGMDDIETSSFFEPRLTTMAQPFIQIGELAAQKLIFHIDHPDDYTPSTDMLNYELIVRSSTR